MFFVYILRCADDTLYTGITNDVEKRLHHHNTTKTGAKYTSGRRPVELVYTEKHATKGEALSREAVIKRLSRDAKLTLIALSSSTEKW
jgi:putative endonuclease